MRLFQVWMEGYAATGNSGTAQYCGTFQAETFTQAVEQYVAREKLDDLFDKETLTYWGCRFFDNEQAARERFG